jgi:glycosyltransferase involved in cell wall biosynthesis
MRLLGRARLMVISSRMEGGANVVSEALRLGVPVVASKVSGNIGMLGVPYAGYYPVGNERALARILSRAERDHEYYGLLKNACAARGPLVAPERERAALRALISECTAGDHVEPRGARSSPLLKTSLFS